MKTKKLLTTLRGGILTAVFLGTCMVVTSVSPSIAMASASSDMGNGSFKNPVIYSDVPDNSVIRVGDSYYMASTTMHLSPGCPIMKSKDLVNWEIVNYVYDTLGSSDATNLTNGKDMYGKGQWAASLNYHAGKYYISFMSYTTGKTYIYDTTDIENGTWNKHEINGTYHDQSLFFDDDGRVYMLYGSGDIKIVELNADCSGIKYGGKSGTLFNGNNLVGSGLFEGTHISKINGYYYVFNICWPSGKCRTETCYRSKSLNGPWEGKVVLQNNGVAQGGIIDTKDGKWYGFLFQDHGAVGRTPAVVPVNWQNGWPMMGNNGSVPSTMTKPVSTSEEKTIVKSDEFDGKSSGKTYKSGLGLVWQWNHNPDNNNWSLNDRPGYLRLKTGRTAQGLTSARNTLTQRTYGPKCSGEIAMDVSNMKNGDVAGLSAFCYGYGYVGVKMDNNSKKIVMVNAGNDSNPREIQSANLNGNKVYFKIDFDFAGGDKANFYYSTNGTNWNKIGNTLSMSYSLKHFMGYRFGLFNYATRSTGGFVDFDYFRVSDDGKTVTQPTDPTEPTNPSDGDYATLNDGWYKIKNVHAQKYLTVKDNAANAGQNVELVQNLDIQGQKWQLKNVGNGYITLTSALGNYMLDIAAGKNEDGANIQIYNAYSGDAQRFLLKNAPNGSYAIATKISNTSKVLDDYANQTNNGANVCQWSYGGRDNQQWIFEKVN